MTKHSSAMPHAKVNALYFDLEKNLVKEMEDSGNSCTNVAVIQNSTIFESNHLLHCN